jgi:hypothetical protein
MKEINDNFINGIKRRIRFDISGYPILDPVVSSPAPPTYRCSCGLAVMSERGLEEHYALIHILGYNPGDIDEMRLHQHAGIRLERYLPPLGMNVHE